MSNPLISVSAYSESHKARNRVVNSTLTTNVLPMLATAGRLTVLRSVVLSGCDLCSSGSDSRFLPGKPAHLL